MVRTEGLAYSYNSQKKIAFRDFDIAEGQHWLLLGESGSGKTTLLHLLGGLLRSKEGRIDIDGTDISKLSEAGLDRFRGKNIGFIFQKNHLISALSVKHNLLMAPFLAGVELNPDRVEAVLSQLGLKDKANENVKELSYGQAQRVAIARAVLNQPRLILADEPTSSLDDTNCERVINLLLEASTAHKATLVVATHDHRLKSKIQNHFQF
jgi:ABC-type lipoprotein export system ATPase subunit